MKETDKAYIAGFLEARNFRPHMSKGTWQVITHISVKHSFYIERIAKLIGAKMYERYSLGFAETFLHNGRPAVFHDGIQQQITLYLNGRSGQKLILSISKYLHPNTMKRFKPLLEHRFTTVRERCRRAGLASAKSVNSINKRSR